jgi:LPS export ABC transporter protein LptC
MAILTRTGHKKLKLVLYLLGTLALCAILAVFIGYRFWTHHPEAILPLLRDTAELSIGSVHQTATRNGIAQWTLKAASARFFEERGETVFENPEITFFTDNNDKLDLSADQGVLTMDTQDILVRDHVVVRYNGYLMKTAALHYHHKMRIIFSNDSVDISGSAMQLTARSMVLHIDTGKVDFTGQVKGKFIGNFTF